MPTTTPPTSPRRHHHRMPDRRFRMCRADFTSSFDFLS
uniref:Uncharacterized protein n=1 Tax=Arundo donax TaxID=35708 RepID=A0A0A9FWN4_ARUDO